jgi:hypothetical protein
MFDGGCTCGAIRFRLNREPIFTNCCHCRDCQRMTGSAFAINAMIEADQVEVLTGGEDPGTDEFLCLACGTLLWALHPHFGPGIRFVRVGTLDEGERVAPDAHFFVRSKHPWIRLPDGVSSFKTLPTEEDAPLFGEAQQARVAAAQGRAQLAGAGEQG